MNAEYAYDMIDRFLRSNLGDDDYAEYSEALDALLVASSEVAALKAERDALLTALRVIAFMQHDIGSPPIISVEEAMRRKARAAIAKAEGEKS